MLNIGDTFGYVRQWTINFLNGIELKEIKIRRFDGDKITLIIVVNNEHSSQWPAPTGVCSCGRLRVSSVSESSL
jgi:hypothetical protein